MMQTLNLRVPVKHEGHVYDHLDIAAPSTEQLAIAMSASNEVAGAIDLLCDLTGWPRDRVEEIRLRDFRAAIAIARRQAPNN